MTKSTVTGEPTVIWSANSDVQKAFLKSSARFVLIGGGAGFGKSTVLLVSAAYSCANPRSRAIIFRKDLPSLRQMISASYHLFVPMRATYSKAEHTWTFPSGATVMFAHLEDEIAMMQHAGAEYNFIGFDELTQLPGDSVDSKGQPINGMFAFLMSRLRAPKDSGLDLEVRATATPGFVGMAWVKSFFHIPDSGQSSSWTDPETGLRRVYLGGTVKDNPALAGTNYEKQLANLPEARRKALLLGDWTICEGQVFEEYRYDWHTCEPFKVPNEWKLWRGIDDGYVAPACCLYLAYDKIYDRTYVVDELYRKGLTARELAKAILAIDETFERDEPLDGVIDSGAFADLGSGSRGQELNELGLNLRPCEKGPGSRVASVAILHSKLALKPDGKPGLIIFRSCKNLISTLPAMTYDNAKPEDINPACEEHAVKALSYGLGRREIVFKRVRVKGI